MKKAALTICAIASLAVATSALTTVPKGAVHGRMTLGFLAQNGNPIAWRGVVWRGNLMRPVLGSPSYR